MNDASVVTKCRVVHKGNGISLSCRFVLSPSVRVRSPLYLGFEEDTLNLN